MYVNRLCTEFGGQRKRKVCQSGKDIGRAYNMSHAEQVAGTKYGCGVFLWSISWLELVTLEFERFIFTDGLEMAKKVRTVRWEGKFGQACG